MSNGSNFRGNAIYFDAAGECRYSDSGELTAATWKERPCGHCHRPNRPDEHDACLGKLPGVINACCGHGNVRESYIQFEDQSIERYEKALAQFDKLGGLRMTEMKSRQDLLQKVAELEKENEITTANENSYWNINVPIQMVAENNLYIEALKWALGEQETLSQFDKAMKNFAEAAKCYLGKSVRIYLKGSKYDGGITYKVTGCGPDYFDGHDAEGMNIRIGFADIAEIMGGQG